MSLENIIAVLAVVAVIAGAAERFVEIIKPLLLKIKNADWLKSAKVTAAVLVSFGLAALFQFDMLARLTIVGVPPVVGFAAAGLFASIGSSGIHAILEWLKTIKKPDVTETSTTVTHTETAPAAE